MIGMVLLIGIGLALVCLLAVVMVSATRYLLAHPDEPVHQHGDGGWSSADDTKDAGAAQSSAVPAPRAAPMRSYDVPLDDMPAEAIAEAAQRLRNQSS